MTCANCGRVFSTKDAQAACKGCGQFGGCHLVRCPYCGYEQPLEPAWIGKLRDLLAKAGLGVGGRDRR